MGGNLLEANLIRLVLPLDEELMVVGGDELDVHRLGALAATDSHRGSGIGSGGLHVLAHADESWWNS